MGTTTYSYMEVDMRYTAGIPTKQVAHVILVPSSV
jgi:hypothetical protein